jgi:DNA invertase Pin-like site-specific DNA recombinase
MAVYGYRRVSSETQEEGASLDQQADKINALTMLATLDSATIFTDVCSGSVALDKRPGGAAMLAHLKSGDTVICTKLDRMFRDATDALSRADWFKSQGINLILIDMGTEPVTQNGVSRMFFGMLALMAEFERTRIKERLSDGRTGKKAKGGHIGGRRPFGYNVEGTGKAAVLTPNEEEQKLIPTMKEMAASGHSLRAISAWLETQGHKLSHEGVKKVLERAA